MAWCISKKERAVRVTLREVRCCTFRRSGYLCRTYVTTRIFLMLRRRPFTLKLMAILKGRSRSFLSLLMGYGVIHL